MATVMSTRCLVCVCGARLPPLRQFIPAAGSPTTIVSLRRRWKGGGSQGNQFGILSQRFHKPGEYDCYCQFAIVTSPTLSWSTGENHKTDGYIVTHRTRELLTKHLEETGGKVLGTYACTC